MPGGVPLAPARAVAGLGAAHLVARPFDRAHRHPGGLHAARSEVAHDLGIAHRHRACHGPAQVTREQLAQVELVGHRLDGAVQRGADDLGAQRVAAVVDMGGAQKGAHVAVEFAQLGFGFVGDELRDAVGHHALLDLLIVHQAERLPVGGTQRAARRAARCQVAGDLVAQRVAKGGMKDGNVAHQVNPGQQHQVALDDASARLGHRAEHVGHAIGDGSGGRLDLAHRRVECGL